MSYELGNSYPYWNEIYQHLNKGSDFIFINPFENKKDNPDCITDICNTISLNIKKLTFMMMFEKVIPISLTTLCLCGVYACHEFSKYPILVRIDYQAVIEEITRKARLSPGVLWNFYLSEKFKNYDKQWLQHLNFYTNEPKLKCF